MPPTSEPHAPASDAHAVRRPGGSDQFYRLAMRYGVALSPISRYAVVDARQYPDDGFAAIAEGTAASVSHRAERLCGKSLRLHPGVFARAAALSKWGYDGVVAHDLANPQATGTASAGSSGSEANTVRVSGVD